MLSLLFIDGRFQNASSNRSYDNINPATGETVSRVQLADLGDVDKAVEAARKGFEIWSAMTGLQRGRILMKASCLLRQRNDELARLEAIDTGKPLQEAIAVDIQSGTDADLDNAVSAAILGNFYTQGEICSNATRVFVHSSILERFLEKLVARVKKMVIGDPLHLDTHVGSLIGRDHMEKVLGFIEAGKAAGARLEAGICWINSYNLTPVEIPFGGNKLSGIGRKNSLNGHPG